MFKIEPKDAAKEFVASADPSDPPEDDVLSPGVRRDRLVELRIQSRDYAQRCRQAAVMLDGMLSSRLAPAPHTTAVTEMMEDLHELADFYDSVANRAGRRLDRYE